MKNNNAVLLTEVITQSVHQGTFQLRLIALPVTRIAKVVPYDGGRHPIEAYRAPSQSMLTLRTPEDGLTVAESVAHVATLMNTGGQGTPYCKTCDAPWPCRAVNDEALPMAERLTHRRAQ